MRIDYPRAQRTGVRRFVPSWRQWLAMFGVAFLLGFLTLVAAYSRTTIPSASAIATSQSTILYWDDGKTELARLGQNRTDVPLTAVPLNLQHAVLAAEDRNFYSHGGFSATGIARAAWNDATGGATQGGSTITQQYAKNAYLSQQRSFRRKAKELLLAVKLDRTRSKDQILEDYLNTIYFGRGAYGVEAASEAYFGKPVSQLTLAQSAVIASVLRSPGFYDPDTVDGLQRLENRWNAVLNGMVENGWITAAERARQTFPRIVAPRAGSSVSGPNGYLVQMVLDELTADGFTAARLTQGGLRIVTTFNKDAQAAAVAAVRDAGPTTNTKGVRTGLVSMNPANGAVVAVYGGKNFVKEYNAATVGRLAAGSTFKPFGLVAGLDQGLSLSSTFDGSSPQTYTLPDGSKYPDPNVPGQLPYIRNDSDGEAFGPVTMLRATQDSINTAYVGMNIKIGPKNTKNAAIKLGVPATTPGLNNYPVNVLGPSTPHVIDMATAYSTIANRGVRTQRHVIATVTSTNGGLLYEARTVPTRVFPESIMDDTTFALQNVVLHGTGRGAQALGRPAAGKTGTTTDFKSAWFVGFTPQLVTAVGMYREDAALGTPLSLAGVGGRSSFYGGGFPTDIWTAYMTTALQGQPVEQFAKPANGGSTGVYVPPPVTVPSTPTGKPSASSSATSSATGKPSSSPSSSASASSRPPSSTSTPTGTTVP